MLLLPGQDLQLCRPLHGDNMVASGCALRPLQPLVSARSLSLFTSGAAARQILDPLNGIQHHQTPDQVLWPPLPSSAACQAGESSSQANSSPEPPIRNLSTLQQAHYSKICFQDSPPSSCRLLESNNSIQILGVSGAACLIVFNPEVISLI